jgi:hypothetical protein
MKKRCSKCRKLRNTAKEFAWRSKAKKRLQAWCIYCQRGARIAHYQSHPEQYKQRKMELIKENQTLYVEYLQTHPCVDCPETDIRALEPDHVRGMKFMNVSKMIKSFSWAKILAELDKCEIRCASCHRKKTCAEQGWFKEFDWLNRTPNQSHEALLKEPANNFTLTLDRVRKELIAAAHGNDPELHRELQREFDRISAIYRRRFTPLDTGPHGEQT